MSEDRQEAALARFEHGARKRVAEHERGSQEREEEALKESGFSLIEILIVLIMMGILAAISIPIFSSFRENSIRTSCVANQRNIVQAANLFALETSVGDTVFNVTLLQTTSYANAEIARCPSSVLLNQDDYTITISSGRVSSMRCEVMPVPHEWAGNN